MSKNIDKIMIGWTTFPSKEASIEMVKELVSENLIACGQIEGPIDSYYTWKQSLHVEKEWRVVVKYPCSQKTKIEKALIEKHPYEVPQWVTIGVEAGKLYSDWVRESCPINS